MDLYDVNRNLVRLMDRMEIKRQVLGRKAGLTRDAMYRICHCQRQILAEEAANLARAMGIPIEALYQTGCQEAPDLMAPRTVNHNVKRLLKEKRVTRQALADRLGWDRETVQNVTGDNRKVGAEEAADIAAALGVPLAELFKT